MQSANPTSISAGVIVVSAVVLLVVVSFVFKGKVHF